MPDNSKLEVARPTINVGGQDSSSLSEGLLEMTIAENIEGLYRCEAVFGNWGPINNSINFLYFDRQTLDFGKAFQVKLGTDVILDGRITGMEAHFMEAQPPQFTVLVEDRFQDLRMTRRTPTVSDA